MATRSWIVIADPTKALFMAAQGVLHRGKWTLVDSLENPQARAKPRDLLTDKPGRVEQSGAPSYRSAMEPPTPIKRAISDKFAQRVARRLDEGRKANAYDRLLLVAPPTFIGLLRHHIPAAVAHLVRGVMEKDYVHVPQKALTRRLSEQLGLQ